MSLAKISIIGAGQVGATLAHLVLAQGLGDVVLLDIAEGLAEGKALDLNQAAAVLGYRGQIRGTRDYTETAGSDVVVITSGFPRKPGMSRDDLLRANFQIVAAVVRSVAAASPEAVLIVVTNPLDAMTYTALKVSHFPPQRVMGMAGVLDSARLRSFIAAAAGISHHMVQAMVLGGHGDEMAPCLSWTRLAGAPVEDFLNPETLQAIVQRTRSGGAEIVQLLKTSSAYYAPAASTVRMLAAILQDEKALLACAAWLQGEYGYQDVVLGVPVILGRRGIERIQELALSPTEQADLARSAHNVQQLCAQVDELLAQKCD